MSLIKISCTSFGLVANEGFCGPARDTGVGGRVVSSRASSAIAAAGTGAEAEVGITMEGALVPTLVGSAVAAAGTGAEAGVGKTMNLEPVSAGAGAETEAAAGGL